MNVGRYLRGEDRHVGTARTTQPQPPQRTEQEPAGWEVGVVDGVVTRRLAPPQRKPLTDEEIDKLLGPLPRYADEWSMTDFIRFARAIEAAHGIKENT